MKLKSPATLKIETPCGGIYAEPTDTRGWNCSLPGGKQLHLGMMRIAEAVEELKALADERFGGAGEALQMAVGGGWVPFSPSINGRRDAAARREIIAARKATA